MSCRPLLFAPLSVLPPLVPGAPAAALDLTSEIQALAAPAAKPILPRPAMRVDWKSADKGFWMAGESPEPQRDGSGQIVFLNGSGTLGARHESLRHRGLSLATVPLIRAEAAWDEQASASREAVGVAVFEELNLALPAGLTFRAKGGIGDRTGVSAPNPRGLASGLAVRGEAGFSASLAPLGQADARLDLQVISTQSFASGEGEAHPPATCELKLELASRGTAPLRIGGSCPGGSGEGRITLSIGGRF